MVAILGWGSICPACEDVEIDYSTFAGHSVLAAWEVLLATSLALDSFVDEATFAVEDSFAVTTAGKALDTGDYLHVAVWQVLVSNWVSKLELVVERQLELLPFDYRNSATFHVPFDEAFEPDCVPGGSDESLDSLALPSMLDVDLRSTNDASLMAHVDFVAADEIVVGIEPVVELRVMNPERVVGPQDSSRDVVAGVAVAVAAVDDFEVFESSEIVGSAECRLEANQRDPD